MAFLYTNKKGEKYYLNKTVVKLRGSGKMQTLYFFRRNNEPQFSLVRSSPQHSQATKARGAEKAIPVRGLQGARIFVLFILNRSPSLVSFLGGH